MNESAQIAGVLTLARVRRVRELYRPSDGPSIPFTSGCPWCGLDGALYRPCAGGRSWTVRCRCCGARSFAQNPRQFFAPSTVIDRVGQGGDQARIRFITRLDQLGHRALQALPWEAGEAGGRTVLQLPKGQADPPPNHRTNC